MKFACVIIVATTSFHIQAGPETDKPKYNPMPMTAGSSNLKETPRESFRHVLDQIGRLTENHITEMAMRAAQNEIAVLQRILPEWCLQAPVSILLYVGFEANDSDLERAKKYLHLGLLVRDMYLDLHINRETLLTFDTPQELRLDDQARYRLVARSFLECFNRVNNLYDAANADLLLSLADLGNWTLHYLQVANETDGELSFQVALAMNRFANLAMLDRAHETHDNPRLTRLAQASMNIIARQLAPVLALALMTGSSSI